MATKQEKARIRNWLKARIMGSLSMNIMAGGDYVPIGPRTTRESIVTGRELEIIREIAKLKTSLLDYWDESSKELGMNIKSKKDKWK